MRTESGARRDGYTLVELIVALLLFAIGGLALASTSAVMGRGLNGDAVRERAARLAVRQIEILAAECHSASAGRQSLPQIELDWSVARPDSNRVDVMETVSYPGSNGRRVDSYRAIRGCR